MLIDQNEEHGDVESLELLNRVRETGEQMGLILYNKIGGNKGDG